MGLFDDFVGGPPPAPEELPPEPAASAPPPADQEGFSEFVGAGTPPPAAAPPPRQAELRSHDPDWTEYLTSKGQDALIYLGAKPHVARHLSEAGTNIASTLTPFGSVLSGANATYNAARGNYGKTILDTIGALPAVGTARRLWRGTPAPAVIPAHDPPPWAQGRVPASVGGHSPETRGWVTPSSQELHEAGTRGYGEVARSPILYAPESGQDVARLAIAHIEHPNTGAFSVQSAPGTYGVLNDTAAAWAQRGWPHGNRPINAVDFDTLRKQLRNLPGADGVAGGRAADMIEAYMAHPPAHRVISGSQGDFNNLRTSLAQARGDWRSYKTADAVETAIDRAGTRAGATYSGRNLGNATRSNLAAFSNSDAAADRIFGATTPERVAIWEASQGTRGSNAQRSVANLLGGGGGMAGMETLWKGMMGGGAVGAGLGTVTGVGPVVGGALGAVAGPVPFAVGRALNTRSNEAAVRAAQDAATEIRRHSPEYAARLQRAGPTVDNARERAARALTMSILPQATRAAGNGWESLYIPYANR